MDDQDVIGHINQLAHEEHTLWEKESKGEATDADRSRLRQIQVTLDQCWDYLNQRRAAGCTLEPRGREGARSQYRRALSRVNLTQS